MPVNRRITLAARPVGQPRESDFALDEVDLGSPAAGEVLVGVLWASVDPYQRGRMSEARSYAPSLQLGDVITSQSVGRVVETKDPRFRSAISSSGSSAGRSTRSRVRARSGASRPSSTRRPSRCTPSA